MSEVGFAARARVIQLKLAGTEPVDVAAIAEEGAAGRGLYAAEELLFGEGSDALATGDARRCEYAQSVTTLAAQAAAPVVEAWTTGDAVTTFVEGLDGGQQSTVALLLNELSHRLDELDMMQLRDMAAADGPDDLDATRLGGPADERLAERAALLGGVRDAIGDGHTGVSALVAAKDADTADRMVAAADAATDALGELPPSVTAAFDDPTAIKAAADAVAKLKVLLATEAASKLGVTITFSDSDGDS
jgi:predicted lipoprotein